LEKGGGEESSLMGFIYPPVTPKEAGYLIFSLLSLLLLGRIKISRGDFFISQGISIENDIKNLCKK